MSKVELSWHRCACGTLIPIISDQESSAGCTKCMMSSPLKITLEDSEE